MPRTYAARSEPRTAEAPTLDAVVAALDDPDCRAVISELDAPKTAESLSEACDIPSSTLYRKLDRLVEASLLDERIVIRADGRHTTRYGLAFDQVLIGVGDGRSMDVSVERPTGERGRSSPADRSPRERN